ncbi:MAG: GNAT family N-acetyltransferase [Candidatus Shapirobacteria bacterium]|nr:GNAT family N-acetyltransferase [Candidatus Shapirobacteria bacterium]
MSKLKISQAGTADISTISKIQKKAWLATYPNLGTGVTRADILKKDFTGLEPTRYQNMADDNWRYFLAQKDNQTIGYAAAKKEADQGIIKLVHVLPQFQNQGVGSVLLEQVLKWLVGKRIVLQVARANFGTIAFYQKFGFSPIGPGRPIKVAGKEIATLKMVIPNT